MEKEDTSLQKEVRDQQEDQRGDHQSDGKPERHCLVLDRAPGRQSE